MPEKELILASRADFPWAIDSGVTFFGGEYSGVLGAGVLEGIFRVNLRDSNFMAGTNKIMARKDTNIPKARNSPNDATAGILESPLEPKAITVVSTENNIETPLGR